MLPPLLESQSSEIPAHGPTLISKSEIQFAVWAPVSKSMSIRFERKNDAEVLKMKLLDRGYFTLTSAESEGTNYSFLLNGRTARPDPASRLQSKGVHGPSTVTYPSNFEWHDRSWKGLPLSEIIIYEIHVGTFTRRGKFESIIPFLDYIRDLGVTALEVMPVAQFPGDRNWGYDGVDLFAPQNSYGSPRDLKKLVDSCHSKGLCVILDVVYNHLGPEGNYLPEFGPYFSYKYRTPWGPAINYDESGSDEVRRFVVQNALYWLEEFHFDGLRLDAVDKIFDYSPRHILLEIKENVQRLAEVQQRQIHIIAESDYNDPKILRAKEVGGYLMDTQWSDDFHHSVHSFLTGERFRYYGDFGQIEDIAKSMSSAFVYDGKYSEFRGKTFGAPTGDLGGEKFVFCIQNHDQVGNHSGSLRLSSLVSFEKLKLSVALLLFSQCTPMLFMGEEYAEKAPFYFFASHSEKELVEAVRAGRKKEHPPHQSEDFVDPFAETTFRKSKLDQSLRSKGMHKVILEYYRDAIKLRSSSAPLKNLERDSQNIELFKDKNLIVSTRRFAKEEMKCYFNLGTDSTSIENPEDNKRFKKVFDSTTYLMANIRDKKIGNRESSGNNVNLSPLSTTVYSARVSNAS
jgi:maltooligosyltrehalose trehalohydrolase